MRCTTCGSENVFFSGDYDFEAYECRDCGESWEKDVASDQQQAELEDEEPTGDQAEADPWLEMIRNGEDEEKERRLSNS